MGGNKAAWLFLYDQAPENFSIEPQREGGRVSQGSHVEFVTVFFRYMHAFNSELVQFLYAGAKG